MNDDENTNQIDSNGLKQGIWKHYDVNNELIHVTSYVDDKMHGFRRWYDEMGIKFCDENFENDVLEGEEIIYEY